MSRSTRLYLLGLLVLFGAYVALEYYRPKPLDWSPTLSNKDKIPYGTYALFDALPALLQTEAVESVRLPVYNQLFGDDETLVGRPAGGSRRAEEGPRARRAAQPDSTQAAQPDSTQATRPDSAQATRTDSTRTAAADPAEDEEADEPDEPANLAARLRLPERPTSYLFVNQTFTTSKAEARALLAFVAAGNDVLIAAEQGWNGRGRGLNPLLDSLGLRFYDPDSARVPAGRTRDSVRVHFVNPALEAVGLQLPTGAAGTRLTLRRGLPGTTLAADGRERAVVVRVPHGRGQVLVCAVPLALSNYFVLPGGQRRFALALLSYLPVGRAVWWDEYQKQGRVGEQSLLRLIRQHEALRWAYYLLLTTAVLYLFVAARRRQRVIPVIKPLPNTTLLFTRTVAGLYRQGRHHGLMAEKKVSLFLDYLRQRFGETAPDLADEAFRERLSQRAGVPRPRVDELLRQVNFARTAPDITDRELLTLSRAIQNFKRESR